MVGAEGRLVLVLVAEGSLEIDGERHYKHAKTNAAAGEARHADGRIEEEPSFDTIDDTSDPDRRPASGYSSNPRGAVRSGRSGAKQWSRSSG